MQTINISMRIKYLPLILLLTAGLSCNRNRVTIDGSIEGGEGASIYFERLDVNRTVLVDSVKVDKKGSFSISTGIDEPELFILRHSRGGMINLLLFPGDRVTVETSREDFGSGYLVEGSPESDNIRQLVEHLENTRAVLDSLETAAEAVGEPDDPRLGILRTAYAQAIVKQKRYTIRYLIENMHSLSSVYALYQKYDRETLILAEETDLQYFKAVADSLEVTYPNSSLTRSLRADIRQREDRFNQEKKLNTLLSMAEEAGLLDLSIPDREGNQVELASLQGKVVLVVFWASASRQSIDALLNLRPVYERYRPKGFEIYAVSMDNNRIRWMNAIDFNEFDWINVSELSYPESRAAQLYNVTELPTSFLINREGDMMARNLYGKTLETWLENLL